MSLTSGDWPDSALQTTQQGIRKRRLNLKLLQKQVCTATITNGPFEQTASN
jgi:hypothetical protein